MSALMRCLHILCDIKEATLIRLRQPLSSIPSVQLRFMVNDLLSATGIAVTARRAAAPISGLELEKGEF